MGFSISKENIAKGLNTLNTFNSTEGNGTTRVLFTDEEVKAREYIKSLMQECGLTVTEDAIGNIFGTLEGTDPTLSPVWSGSHIDTVLNAGMFDGMAGVISAIEALRAIKESGLEHKRNLTAIVYTSEEPTRFGISCIGSRAMAGHLTLEDSKKMKDEQGISLYDLLVKLGFPIDKFDEVKKEKDDVFASVELHIEQAAVLDRLKLPVGVVEGICGASYINVTVKGVQEHAGSTPMDIRKDPMCAASEIILETEKAANEISSINAVATVGKLNVFPNAANVIPGQVDFVIDIRDVDMASKDGVIKRIISFMEKVASERGVKIEYTVTGNDVPRMSDKRIVKILEEHCKEMKLPYKKMVSGAYHDSLLVAEFAPMAMIFVPSKDGISHHKAEFTEMADIACGAELLANTLFDLANMEV